MFEILKRGKYKTRATLLELMVIFVRQAKIKILLPQSLKKKFSWEDSD